VILQVGGEGLETRRNLLAQDILGAEDPGQEIGHHYAEAVVPAHQRVEVGRKRREISGQEPKVTLLALEVALEPGAEMVEFTAQSSGPGARVRSSARALRARTEKARQSCQLEGEIAMLVIDGAEKVRC